MGADAATEGYYTYEVTDGVVTITGCDTAISGEITIPATLGGYPVTTIGNRAFSSCSSLTSVTIPDSVTTIENGAFYYCPNLTDVYYGGTQVQWAEIAIGAANTYLTDATIHYADASLIAPGDLDGNETVDKNDAIYLLQHVLLPDLFPIEQPVDYDGNGCVDVDDALYLLLHVLLPEHFPL